MNNPDHKSSVCGKDSYGNVTANKQGGDDIRNERHYKGFTIDIGITCTVWSEDDSWFGRFPDVGKAKVAIDTYYKLK